LQRESFLQSNEWMEFQKSLGREVFRLEVDHISANVMEVKLPLGKHYLYVSFGPVVDFNAITGSIKQEIASFIGKLKSLAREQDSVFIKIEPRYDSVAGVFVDQGFRKPRKETTPHRTVILDIDRDDNDILGTMHHKTRYNIVLAEKKDIEVKESDDVRIFARLVRETAKRNSKTYPLYSEEYYKKFLDFFNAKAKLYLAFENSLSAQAGEAIAGAIISTDGNTGYYMYGGSSRKHASLMAPYLLHWHIIKELRSQGIKKYDLWMIDPRRWPGVTRFKLGWGGQQIEYPGSFDLPVRKFWYLIYKTYRAIFR